MSLEAAIEANTIALNALTAAIGAGIPNKLPAGLTHETVVAGKPANLKTPAPPAAPTGAATPLTYDDAKPYVLELSKVKGREAAEVVLAQFPHKDGGDLKPKNLPQMAATPENFGKVISACKLALAA